MSLLHISGAAGADEAGRGPLAGPLVVAGVLLPDGFDIEGLDDSKRLDHDVRQELELRIKAEAQWRIAVFTAEEVDRLNPLRASLEGMARCLNELNPAKGYVDGNMRPPGVAFEVEAVIKGDGKIACIAAASILAKNERDRLMVAMAEVYPGYGFESHFGYATPAHMESLRELGPCPEHRKTYKPIKEMLAPPDLQQLSFSL